VNRFIFKQTQTVVNTVGIVAHTVADAHELALRRNPSATFSLEQVQPLQWLPIRREVTLGEWYNDEYERHYSNEQQLEPCETLEDAKQAIKEQWNYESEFFHCFDDTWTSSDYSKMIHLEYEIKPVVDSSVPIIEAAVTQ